MLHIFSIYLLVCSADNHVYFIIWEDLFVTWAILPELQFWKQYYHYRHTDTRGKLTLSV